MSNIAVLVLGGCGFVGRNLVELLVKEPDVAFIRVVDKVPPQMAWLSRKHASVFESEKVQFSSCNLLSKLSREKVFLREGMRSFDFVINLAAETKPGQDEAVYREGIVSLSVACAEEALKTGVKRYVELSSGNMGSSEKHPMKENANPEPWTEMAKHKRIVEQKLSKMIHDLDIIFIRPPLVYGRADRNSLMPWIAIAAVYKHLSETMEILWTEKLRRDVCHVTDLSRAIWHLTLNGKRGEVYNITDMSETTLGEIIDVICGMINVKYSFLGNFWSSLAKVIDEFIEQDLFPASVFG
ncbi:uncharacterized protein LOC136038009 isoform X2 [Artemia franciscana]|uniref:uncharacterized protein LOC136038009 isoform X2 n=1 Tax=Artemia franciscana TaxID=6661 RepID=UPI0032D9E344